MTKIKNTKISKTKFIKDYQPYLEQLETADRFLKENDNKRFDASNLAVLYKHLINSMPKDCLPKYNLNYYSGFDVKNSYQGRYLLGKYKDYPCLYILKADDNKIVGILDTTYEKVFNDKNTAHQMIKEYHRHDKFCTPLMIGSALCCVMGIISIISLLSLISLNSNMSILSVIMAVVFFGLAILCCVYNNTSATIANTKFHKTKAKPQDLEKGIQHISSSLQTDSPFNSNYNLEIAKNDYGKLVKSNYDHLCKSKHNWNDINKSVHKNNVNKLIGNRPNQVSKLLKQKQPETN